MSEIGDLKKDVDTGLYVSTVSDFLISMSVQT